MVGRCCESPSALHSAAVLGVIFLGAGQFERPQIVYMCNAGIPLEVLFIQNPYTFTEVDSANSKIKPLLKKRTAKCPPLLTTKDAFLSEVIYHTSAGMS